MNKIIESIKKNKSYIIILVIIFLIISVFIVKQLSSNIFNNSSDSNYLDQNSNGVVKTYKLYNFGSSFCSACKRMESIYENIKEEYKLIINFEYIDVNKNVKLSNTYDIEYTPTFIIVDETGAKVDKLIGYVSEDEFRKFVDKWSNK